VEVPDLGPLFVADIRQMWEDWARDAFSWRTVIRADPAVAAAPSGSSYRVTGS
jgi:hypothetical protein